MIVPMEGCQQSGTGRGQFWEILEARLELLEDLGSDSDSVFRHSLRDVSIGDRKS